MKNLIVFMLFGTMHCYSFAQDTIVIFKDDKERFDTYLECCFEDSTVKHSTSLIQFKDRLPDGKYFYVNIRHKDSLKLDWQSDVILSGAYVNGMRHGLFTDYDMVPHKKQMGKIKDISVLARKRTYNMGKLDGLLIIYVNGKVSFEGHYHMGRKDGFFYYYEFNSCKLMKVLLFKEDELMAESKPGDPSKVIYLKDED